MSTSECAFDYASNDILCSYREIGSSHKYTNTEKVVEKPTCACFILYWFVLWGYSLK